MKFGLHLGLGKGSNGPKANELMVKKSPGSDEYELYRLYDGQAYTVKKES